MVSSPAVVEPASAGATMNDADRDSLYVLPLSMIPLQTPSLSRARLIKNVRLDGVIEVFDDEATGSGQLMVEDLPHEFNWPDVPVHPDLQVLRKLAPLASYDVYSLRILLRECGIEVNDQTCLRLSMRKMEELTNYMRTFTRPLIQNIYGADDFNINSFDDIINLFKNPDRKKALEKLKVMANKLEMSINEIPKFLEDYGDIFLSLSYYKQCLDHIAPIIGEFFDWLAELQNSWQMRHDANLISTCKLIQATLNEVMAAITGRMENFDRSTADLWSDVSAERFKRVEGMIRSYHTTVGGVLCSLTVKMETWIRVFPNRNCGGPQRRSEFIMSEMRPGIEKIQKIENSAPMLSVLNAPS